MEKCVPLSLAAAVSSRWTASAWLDWHALVTGLSGPCLSSGTTTQWTIQFRAGLYPLVPWYENMTSSVKPKIHNIAVLSEEDWATAIGNMHKKFGQVQQYCTVFQLCKTGSLTEVLEFFYWVSRLNSDHLCRGTDDDRLIVILDVVDCHRF